MTTTARMEWIRDISTKDLPLLFTSAAATLATYIDDIVTALPMLITVFFQLYFRYKKHKQIEKQQQELHQAIIKAMKEGKPVDPGILKQLNHSEDEI